LKEIVIIGGGISGLINAILLSKAGLEVLLIERKSYPFHRVCGEYLSNEAVPFLNSHGLYPGDFNPPQIKKFRLTSVNGRKTDLNLSLGGIGISRFSFDHFLYNKALECGAKFILNTSVESVSYFVDFFRISLSNGSNIKAKLLIGAFGKRSKIDRYLNRNFIGKLSPYLGVKYHIKYDLPLDIIALHNFKGGYCGISNVENSNVNLCYLSERSNLRKYGSIRAMEEEVLYRNPFLKDIFTHAEFLFEKPEVINEISFETKNPVENHILMSGDSAGMITPLCGNGMAMAIYSAKMLSELIIKNIKRGLPQNDLESAYFNQWNIQFRNRLWFGRGIQALFGGIAVSNLAVNIGRYVKPLAGYLINKTHGKPF